MSETANNTTKEKEVNLYPNENPKNATEAKKDEIHHKTERKKLGIYMDHSSASLIGFSSNPTETTTIESEFTHDVKTQSLSKSENIMHNKEQQQQHKFYKELGDVIKDYEEVLLFGPTDAKTELKNILKDDHHFDNIEIQIKQADKMTDNQQHAFVNQHFTN